MGNKFHLFWCDIRCILGDTKLSDNWNLWIFSGSLAFFCKAFTLIKFKVSIKYIQKIKFQFDALIRWKGEIKWICHCCEVLLSEGMWADTCTLQKTGLKKQIKDFMRISFKLTEFQSNSLRFPFSTSSKQLKNIYPTRT